MGYQKIVKFLRLKTFKINNIALFISSIATIFLPFLDLSIASDFKNKSSREKNNLDWTQLGNKPLTDEKKTEWMITNPLKQKNNIDNNDNDNDNLTSNLESFKPQEIQTKSQILKTQDETKIKKTEIISKVKDADQYLQNKKYLIKGKVIPNLKPLKSGKIQTKSQLFNTQGYVKIKGPEINLTVKDADAKDILLSLANIGKYGLVFVPSSNEDSKINLVTLSLQNATYEKAINSVLLASSLQGKFENEILIIGENILDKSFGPNISKVFRLNQISSESAAEYLGSLGATINILTLNSPIKNSSSNKLVSQSFKKTKIESYGSNEGPLRGLIGTSDSRLQTITLIGDPKLISIAEKYIYQLDRRQRQVALEVKILDVNLKDEDGFDNSNFFRSKSFYIVNSKGIADIIYGTDVSNLSAIQSDILGTKTISNIGDSEFLNWFNARLVSSKTNVLANPTLILSENKESIRGGSTTTASDLTTATIGRPFANESFITVGNKVITNYSVVQSESGGQPTCEAEFGTEGITFGAKVHKIDDNGYVTFSLSPELASVTDTVSIPNCGIIKTLSIRRLDTGGVRVKDGQTLILSGVLSKSDTNKETKIPILGSLPIVGNLFSSKSKTVDNSELVIMVSPKIINDEEVYN